MDIESFADFRSAVLSIRVKRSWSRRDFKELADAPVSALFGLSEADAEALSEAFGIKTIADLGAHKATFAGQKEAFIIKTIGDPAVHKAIVAAQAIVALAKLGWGSDLSAQSKTSAKEDVV